MPGTEGIDTRLWSREQRRECITEALVIPKYSRGHGLDGVSEDSPQHFPVYNFGPSHDLLPCLSPQGAMTIPAYPVSTCRRVGSFLQSWINGKGSLGAKDPTSPHLSSLLSVHPIGSWVQPSTDEQLACKCEGYGGLVEGWGQFGVGKGMETC